MTLADFPKIDRTGPETPRETGRSAKRLKRSASKPESIAPLRSPEREEARGEERREDRSFELEYLLSKLDEVGLRLTRFCSLKVLEEYKQTLSALIGVALRSMEVERELRITRRGKEALVVVREIDEKVAKIASLIASREADRVRITQLVEEIKGCVADLLA